MGRPEVRASNVVGMLEERIRTLEDALRPFAEEAKGHALNDWPTRQYGWHAGAPSRCLPCGAPWPCKYETARRALEGTDG